MMTIVSALRRQRLRQTARAVLAALLLGLSATGCASGPGGAAAAGAGGAGQPTPAGPIPEAPTSAAAGGQTIVAIAPPAAPCCKKQTLPEFLGLTDAARAVGGAIHSGISCIATALDLEGRFAGLQPKPPLLPITDPANMNENAPPAVKAAAEAKKEEDSAGQKIMALRYLAELGCGGCYPDIEDALLASLDDCTEEVRFVTVSALRNTNRPNCHYCNSKKCCSNKVQKKLRALAFETNEDGCFKEPSARVRRQARLALQTCGGLNPEPNAPSPEQVPDEGPVEATATTPDNSTIRSRRIASRQPGESGEGIAEVQSTLLRGVKLPNLVALPKSRSAGDPEVARVNGEPLLESQVAPQLERTLAQWQDQGILAGPEAMQVAWQSEVQRAVDVKLLAQRARQELIAQGKLAPKSPLTPERFLDWYEATLPVDEQISTLELTQYYQENASQFQTAARVRYEIISACVSGFRSREEAFAVMQSFRARAQGFQVAEVPFNRQSVQIQTSDWSTRGEVKSNVVGDTLFSLPVGKLSPILDEGDMLYLVRVLERQSAGVKPFDEVADRLRADLLQRRFSQAEQQYVARLRQASQIATIFDGQSGDGVRMARLPKFLDAPSQNSSSEPTPADRPTTSDNPSTRAATPRGVPTPAVPDTQSTSPDSARALPRREGVQPASALRVPQSGVDAPGAVVPLGAASQAGGVQRALGVEAVEASSMPSVVRPANMLELGEKVRQGAVLEPDERARSQRPPLAPQAVPNRRPSTAVIGPAANEWQGPSGSAISVPNPSATR